MSDLTSPENLQPSDTWEIKYVTEHKNHRKNILILDAGHDVTTPLDQYGLVNV